MVMLIMLHSTIESDNFVLQGKEDTGNRNVNYVTDKLLQVSLRKCKL